MTFIFKNTFIHKYIVYYYYRIPVELKCDVNPMSCINRIEHSMVITNITCTEVAQVTY